MDKESERPTAPAVGQKWKTAGGGAIGEIIACDGMGATFRWQYADMAGSPWENTWTVSSYARWDCTFLGYDERNKCTECSNGMVRCGLCGAEYDTQPSDVARAEAERLQGALRRIQFMADEGGITSPDDVLAVGLIAARALAATPGGPNAK